MLIKNVNVKT